MLSRLLLLNDRGYSMFGALLIMMALGYAGMSVVEIAATDSALSVAEVHKKKAMTNSSAGLEYGAHRVTNGYSGSYTKYLEEGDQSYFTTTYDANSGTLTSIGYYGDAQYSQSITVNGADDCVSLDFDDASVSGQEVQNMKLVKTCNTAAIVSSITLTYNLSDCIQGNEDEDDVCAPNYDNYTNHLTSRGKVRICHVPPGNPGNAQSLTVSVNALNGHFNNNQLHDDDYFGTCGGDCADWAPAVAPTTLAEAQACEQDTNGVLVEQVTLTDTVIFREGETPSTSSTARDSGEEIDVADSTLTSNGNYYFNDLTFDADISAGILITARINFADGTYLEETWFSGAAGGGEEVVEEEPEFEVEEGEIIVTQGTVQVEVLGSAITCGAGGPEVYVDVELGIDGVYSDLFNGADVDGGESYTTSVAEGVQQYTIRAHAYKSSCGNFSRTLTSTDTLHVRTLTNGQQAPALSGFGGQRDVLEFLAPYLNESGQVVLNSNQVIQLWELGTNMSTNPNSTAADFQDLVILFTIGN